jgi:hypothetical protein
LERTGCFGTCPIYKLEISAGGKVVYEGKNFVKTKGKVEGNITQEQLGQLIAEFEKANYFSLRDRYEGAEDGCPTSWTDNPSALTSIRIEGRSKSISHDYGCREQDTGQAIGSPFPRELTELEKKIDEIAGTKRWVE